MPRAPAATGLQATRAASLSQRLGIWRAAADLCARRPLLGYGPGAFARALLQAPDPATQSLLRRQPVDDPHNLFLRLLAETGVAGLLAWLALLAAGLHTLRRRLAAPLDPAQRGLFLAALGSACAYLVFAQFNPESIVHALLFWFALGLVACPSQQMVLLSPNATGQKDSQDGQRRGGGRASSDRFVLTLSQACRREKGHSPV